MSLTYALLLIVSNAAGGESVFVVDHNLSKSDCDELRFSWVYTLDSHSRVICTIEQD